MNKVIIKESEKSFIVIDIAFYIIVCMIGVFILSLEGLETIAALKYFYLVFYVIAFFSIIAYFSNRRKNDYELLYYALINVYVGSFALIYINFYNPWFILGCSILIYTIGNALNKMLHFRKLDSDNSICAVSKLCITMTLLLFSFFVSIYLYKGDTLSNLVIGYYFLMFGLLSLIEPFLSIVLKNKTVTRYLTNKEVEDNIKNNKIVKKVIKREVKKPVKKVVKEELKEKEEVKPVVKKKTVKKVTKKVTKKESKK